MSEVKKILQMGNMEAHEVIGQLLKYLGVKAPTLANEAGVLYRRIYDIQSGKTKKISGDLAHKITSKYPEISLQWLLTGDGSMFKGERVTQVAHHSVQIGDITNSRGVTLKASSGGAEALALEECKRQIDTMREQIERKDRMIENLLLQVDRLTTALTSSSVVL